MGRARRTGLLVCGLGSVLAHAALLGWVGQPGLSARRSDAPAGQRLMQITARHLPATIPPQGLPGDVPMLALASERILRLPTPQPLSPLSATLQETSQGAGGEALALDTVGPPAGQAELFKEDGYVPRPRLDVPPVALHALILEWPDEGAPPAGRYRGVVSVYIDEQGIVQHLRFDDDGLPEALQNQARAAFAAVRYAPGKLKDQIVKSRIRLELVFEADPRVVTRGSPR